MNDEVQRVERFVTADDNEFESLAEANKYNKLLKMCNKVEAEMPPLPNNLDFVRGVGWIQHKENTKIELAEKIVDIFNKFYGEHKTVLSKELADSVYNNKLYCLARLMFRWQCMDNKNREFGEPYFTRHFEKVKGSQININ